MLVDMAKHTKTTRPAAIYVRISQDRGGARLGVERQETGMPRTGEAARLDRRRGLLRQRHVRLLRTPPTRLRAHAGRHRGREDHRGDRLASRPPAPPRRPNWSDTSASARRHHVENQTVTAGMWDLSTPSGRMVARQLGAVAAYESEHKSERLKSARIQQAKQRQASRRLRCYGYAKDGITVIADEAAEIASACKAIAAGRSLRAIVRDLNARKVRTATGKIAVDLPAAAPDPDESAHRRLLHPQGHDRGHRRMACHRRRRDLAHRRGDPVQPGAAHQHGQSPARPSGSARASTFAPAGRRALRASVTGAIEPPLHLPLRQQPRQSVDRTSPATRTRLTTTSSG